LIRSPFSKSILPSIASATILNYESIQNLFIANHSSSLKVYNVFFAAEKESNCNTTYRPLFEGKEKPRS